jgi:hypothetical protein
VPPVYLNMCYAVHGDVNWGSHILIVPVYCIVLYCIYWHVPAHPNKVEAFGYRTCHTTTCYNQQVVNRTVHINTSVNQAYKSSI